MSERGTRPASASRKSLPRARSGATRPAPAARSRTVSPPQRTAGQSTGWVRGAILATVLVMLAVTIVPTARSVIRQHSQIEALQDSIAAQENDVRDLQAEQQRWKDPAYVEQQARERLKFVKPGERSYSVIDPAAAAPKLPAGATVAAPTSVGTSPWYGELWQSVQLADRPTAGLEPVAP